MFSGLGFTCHRFSVFKISGLEVLVPSCKFSGLWFSSFRFSDLRFSVLRVSGFRFTGFRFQVFRS